MYCVFKSNGYIPVDHLCLRCTPLETLLSSLGLDEAASERGARDIIRTYRLIELADKERDEGLPVRLAARVSSFITSLTLPPSLRSLAGKVNERIEELEDAEVPTGEYLTAVSNIGGSIFSTLGTTPTQIEALRQLGSRIAGATVVEDMLRDLEIDRDTGNYNPIGHDDEGQDYRADYVGGFNELVDPVLSGFLSEPCSHGHLRVRVGRVAMALTGGCDDSSWDPEFACYRYCGCI